MDRSFRKRIALFVFSISLTFCSCSGSDFYYGEEVEPNCGQLIQHPCDVRSMRCQRDLFELAICAREDESGIFPEVLTIDRDDFKRLLSEAVDSEEEISQEERVWTKAYQLLGLLPEEVSMDKAVTDDLVDEIVGFYSDETKSLVLIDSGEPMDSVETNVTLLHEFVHALQDQTVGLDGFGKEMRNTTDGSLARTALIEGEAIHFMVVAISLMEERDPEDFDWSKYYDRIFQLTMEDIEDSEVPLATATSSIPYIIGGPYITDAYLLSGDTLNTSLFDDPITTTVQWMLGYGDSTFEAASLSCALPQAPEDAERLDQDRFGAVGVLALLVENGLPIDDAWELAKKWRWDEIAVYGSQQETDASTFVAWRTVWASDDDASQFARALMDADYSSENRAIELDGQDVLIVAGDQSEQLFTWTENTECVAPQDTSESERSNSMRKKILPIPPYFLSIDI